MALIGIEGIELKAPVGVYKEEKKYGRRFLVDIFIEIDLNVLDIADDLTKTVDYEKIYNIIHERMSFEASLIETAIALIYKDVVTLYPTLRTVRIRIRKFNPFKEDNMAYAFVEEVFHNNK